MTTFNNDNHITTYPMAAALKAGINFIGTPQVEKDDIKLPTYEDMVHAQVHGEEEYASGASDRLAQVGYAVEGFVLAMLHGHVVQGNTMAAKVRAMRKAVQGKTKAKHAKVRVPNKGHMEALALMAMDENRLDEAEFLMWLTEGIS
jgi:hypothetical protein